MTDAVLESPGAFRLSISDEVEDACAARISLESSIGSAASRVHSLDLGAFLDALSRLHETLSGEAVFESLEGDFGLRFKAASQGQIAVVARLSDIDRSSDFHAEAIIDQTYLPDFIRAAGRLELESWSRAE